MTAAGAAAPADPGTNPSPAAPSSPADGGPIAALLASFGCGPSPKAAPLSAENGELPAPAAGDFDRVLSHKASSASPQTQLAGAIMPAGRIGRPARPGPTLSPGKRGAEGAESPKKAASPTSAPGSPDPLAVPPLPPPVLPAYPSGAASAPESAEKRSPQTFSFADRFSAGMDSVPSGSDSSPGIAPALSASSTLVAPKDAAPIAAPSSGSFPVGGLAPEKFAAPEAVSRQTAPAADYRRDKKTITIGSELHTNYMSAIGTSGAKSFSAMPSRNPAHPSTDIPGAIFAPAAGSGKEPKLMQAPAAPADLGATAKNAVDTVVRLVELRAGRAEVGGHTVHFGLKFGEDNLNVRVELRGGEVRTQFATDSDELRGALAGAWSGLSDSPAARNFHFADPVFSPASGGSAQGSMDGGGETFRQGNRAEPNAPAELPRQPRSEPASISRENSPAVLPPTSQRLQAFA